MYITMYPLKLYFLATCLGTFSVRIFHPICEGEKPKKKSKTSQKLAAADEENANAKTESGVIAEAGGGIASPVDGIATPVGGIATPVGGITTPVGGIATPVGGIETPKSSQSAASGVLGGADSAKIDAAAPDNTMLSIQAALGVGGTVTPPVSTAGLRVLE